MYISWEKKDYEEDFKPSFFSAPPQFFKKLLLILNIRFHLKLVNQRGLPWESKPLTVYIMFTLIYKGSIMLMKNKLAGRLWFALESQPTRKFHAM